MASREETFTAKILVNDSEATSKLQKLQQQLEAVKKRRDEALRDGKIDVWKAANKEADKLEKAVTRQKQLTDGLDHSLRNMSTANQKELETLVKSINKELTNGHVKRGSKEWKELNATLRRTKEQLRLIREEGQEQPSIWGRFFKFLNDSWGGLVIMFQSITGLSATIRKSVQDYADMEEQMADVRKYTGLTADQVKDLNEEFKRMDTRTSREELNQLAGAAGRLGITSKEGIMDFVDAADKIGVALGDDLGEGAVDQIGKLSMAFGEDERLGLRGAMLATGSAINELAQNSAAKAGYLVEFAARVAGVGKQLGLSQAQIMGFATVMDEALLKDEMASTAFSQMITKMATDSAKFAKFAGMEATKFADLVKNDLNGAILALADNIRQQDPTVMLKMFGDMGLDGTRAVGVLTNMADKIDDVRRHQQTANEAYEQGTSVISEFSTMNKTVQARLDKCKKQFQEMTISLGEQLLPVVKYTISSFSLMVKGLSVATSFVMQHKAELLSAAAAIAAYTACVEAKTIAEKAATVATKAMTLATELFNKATKLNPVGLLIAALTAAVVLFVKYRDRINGATEATSMLRQAGAKLMDVLARVAGWLTSLAKMAVTLYDKFSFVRKIVQLLVISFTTGFSTITNGVKLLIDELDGVATIIEGVFTLDWQKIKDGYGKGFKAVADAVVAQLNIVKRGVKDVFSAPPPANGAQVVAAGEQAGKGSNELPEVVVTGRRRKNTAKLTDYKTDAERKQEEQERKKRESEHKQRLKEAEEAAKAESDAAIAAKTHEYAVGRIAYREYIQDMARLQKEGLEKRRDVYEQGSAEYERLNRKVQELAYKGDEQVNRMRLEELQRDMLLQQAEIEAQAAREEITEQQKQESLRMLQESYLADKVELYKRGTKERMDAEWELEQTEQRNKMERERYYQQQLEQVRDQFLGLADERVKELALKNLDDLHAKGLLKEREYQEAKLAIEAQYANYETNIERDQRVGSNALKVAQDRAKQEIDADSVSGGSPAGKDLPILSDVTLYQSTMEQLKQMYQNDEMTHAQYLAAKQQATAQFCASLASQMQAAYDSVNQVLSAASSYFSAQQEYETAQVKAKYDKQIEAAGSNQKKVKKLQEQQQKEEAAIKTKYAKRAAAIQMAQAVAQTAISAINAYSSAAAIPVVGHVLAPIAAAMAIAAGMLQIATIKKQQQAQAAGYYEGGFTGGKRYRREAGVVHEGEFVANHQAVNNRQLMPVFSLLDQAQRNNRVASLRAEDVTNVMGGPASQVIAPIVNVQAPDNSELHGTLEKVCETQDRLADQLEQGIGVDFPIDGENGLYRRLRRYEDLLKNK